MDFLLIAVLFIVLMYVMMGFTRRKQNQRQQEMMNSMVPGDRVLLTSGIFATVRAIGEKQFVVELAPGTEITVLQQAIVRKVTPDQEEFEYSDGVDSAAADVLNPDTPILGDVDAAPSEVDADITEESLVNTDEAGVIDPDAHQTDR